MRACDHQIMMPDPSVKIQANHRSFLFPLLGLPIMIPMDKVAVPPDQRNREFKSAASNGRETPFLRDGGADSPSLFYAPCPAGWRIA